MDRKKINYIFSLVIAVLSALLLLSGSIALPILIRPFYYLHVDLMDIPEENDLSREEVLTAYNEMLDYCLGITDDFSTGVLPWSQSGKDHFTDVKSLFLLDLKVFAVSMSILLFTVMTAIFFKLHPVKLSKKHGPLFWSGLGIGAAFLLIGIPVAIDPDQAFVVFHKIFFPGKTNWYFNPKTDAIINILPESFFIDCGALIFGGIIVGGIIFILADRYFVKHQSK